jgi:hypothetical protein
MAPPLLTFSCGLALSSGQPSALALDLTLAQPLPLFLDLSLAPSAPISVIPDRYLARLPEFLIRF